MITSLSSAEPVLARIDGWPIHVPNLATAVARITARAKLDRGFTVFTLNLDHLVKLRTLRAFQSAYATAGLVTADGAPVAWLSRFQSAAVERTTGADLFVPLAQAAARERLPVFLFGTKMAVLTAAARTLNEATGSTIEIAGLLSPSVRFDPEGPEADAAIARIKASGARLCFVTLGAPKQEIFATRAAAHGCQGAFVCVGAAADFLAGTQMRAPVALRRWGLEWAWRLGTNPRRLAKRYARCTAVLFDVAVVQPVRLRLARNGAHG